MADILLIDDDESIQQIVSLFLKDAGHAVFNALNAPHGITIAENDQPDLILLNMAMPDMDGTEAFHILKGNPKTADIPVMIFTVHDPRDLDEDICHEGCAGYLQKPVNKTDLNNRVNDVLSKARQG